MGTGVALQNIQIHMHTKHIGEQKYTHLQDKKIFHYIPTSTSISLPVGHEVSNFLKKQWQRLPVGREGDGHSTTQGTKQNYQEVN